jgi:hypothetical protein
MNHPKNIQFTILIKAGGRLREFNFRKSQGATGPMFTVDVTDQKDERHYLIFRQKDKDWVLDKKELVAWISEVLPQIQGAIEKAE